MTMSTVLLKRARRAIFRNGDIPQWRYTTTAISTIFRGHDVLQWRFSRYSAVTIFRGHDVPSWQRLAMTMVLFWRDIHTIFDDDDGI